MFIDTHAHLTMPEFKDLAPYLKRAEDAGITKIINASFDLPSSVGSVALAERYGNIYAAVGIHPHDADQVNETSLEQIREMAKNPRVVAIGETGLDYHYKLKPVDQQMAAFRSFLALAQELNKPVIIHSREAQADTIDVIKKANRGGLKGVFHCFAGDD
ncbi:MAG TPA: TatD family hydrolase, partial [Candidatus Omnitrophota bacterium]|nr:TatD family hydrolase [Candidatus Omnitrophota bacterium]